MKLSLLIEESFLLEEAKKSKAQKAFKNKARRFGQTTNDFKKQEVNNIQEKAEAQAQAQAQARAEKIAKLKKLALYGGVPAAAGIGGIGAAYEMAPNDMPDINLDNITGIM